MAEDLLKSVSKDTLLDRLDMLIQFLPGLDVAVSRDVHKLMANSIVLDLSSLEEVPYAFLLNFLVVFLRAVFPQEDPI